tara:strand:+ start:2591 stop:2797 length:207 start_codon:yes stop_codon:yes gene_type:complete
MIPMKTADRLVAHFGDREKTCAALDINPETLRLWLRDGIPLSKSLFVEQKTKRKIWAEDIVREARESA